MRIGAALAAALVVLSAGCGRRAGPPPAPERFLPPDAPLALVLPTLRAAQEQLGPLLRTVAAVPAAAGVATTLAAVRDQLGLDPLDPAALQAAGVDPARGAAALLGPGTRPLLVLPVADRDRLEALVTRLARDRLGAGRRDAATVDGRSVTTFRAGEGAPVALALLVVEGTALLSPGAEGPATVAAAAARPAPETLLHAGAYARARAALGPAAALGYVPPGSPAAAPVSLARQGAALGVSGAADRLGVRAALLMDSGRLNWWRTGVAGTAAATPAPSLLPADAFVAARLEGDPSVLGGRALPLLAGPAETLRRAGLDLERDVLALLAPGAVAGVALAPSFQLAAVSRAPEAAAADPFALLHLAAVLQVKDPASVPPLLDRLARASRRTGVEVSRREVAGRRAWRLTRGPARLELALDGARLLVAGGPGRLEALLAGASGYVPPSEAARAALGGGPAGVVLDLVQLVKSFRALPPAAYGTGPDAFVMRSLADRVVEPASRLLAASARLELVADGVVVDLTVEARPQEGAAR